MYQWLAFSVFMTIVNSGTSLKCYGCKICPEPFDTKTADSMDCKPGGIENNDVLKTFEVAADVDLEKEFVCLTYSLDVLVVNKTATQRSCAPKTVRGQDVCDYLGKIVAPPTSKLLNCTTCNTDLCNA